MKKVNLFLLAAVLLISLFVYAGFFRSGSDENFLPVSYFEDLNSQYAIDDFINTDHSALFAKTDKTRGALGNNDSTWWFEILPDNLETVLANQAADSNFYFVVNNQVVKNVTVFLPLNDGNYIGKNSGWGYEGKLDSDLYPQQAFWIDKDIDWTKPIFVRINSPYSHNYSFEILSRDDFSRRSIRAMFFTGMMLGTILAMIIYQIITFFRLKQLRHLLFSVFMLFIVIYQLILLGLMRVIFVGRLYFLTGYGVHAALIMILSGAFFATSYFADKPGFAKIKKILNFIICLAVPGTILIFSGLRVAGNVYAYFYAFFASLIVMAIAINYIRKRDKESIYFLIGWIFLIITAAVSFLKMSGIIANNAVSSNIAWVAVALQSVIFNIALIDHVKNLDQAVNCDTLTGAGSRSAGIDSLTFAFANFKDTGKSPAIISIDFDNFKAINDVNGHDFGDKVLIEVRKAISNVIRHTDSLYRWGGDEFILLCDNIKTGKCK